MCCRSAAPSVQSVSVVGALRLRFTRTRTLGALKYPTGVFVSNKIPWNTVKIYLNAIKRIKRFLKRLETPSW